jgi:UDP-2-acetamido-3-amino-2,3-dideoxy-glucuronate N-acetyltransferase
MYFFVHLCYLNIINPRSGIIRKEEYMSTIVRKRASICANVIIVCGLNIEKYAFF